MIDNKLASENLQKILQKNLLIPTEHKAQHAP